MARKRSNVNSDLPTGLSFIRKRGEPRYRYRYPSGKEVLFPKEASRTAAIAAAATYNGKHRDELTINLEKKDKFNKRLKDLQELILKKQRNGKKKVANTVRTFELDLERLIELQGHIYSKDYSYQNVIEYLSEYTSGKSNNVVNRKISFLQKVFSILLDQAFIEVNHAKSKQFIEIDDADKGSKKERLTFSNFETIYDNAPHFLKVAMDLSLQTTHAVNEVSKMKYSDFEWLESPEIVENATVYGYLKIHRKKVRKHDSSRVEIPVTAALRDIYHLAKTDKLLSPYLVHKKKKQTNKRSKECTHWTQLTPRNISNEFSKVRDQLGLYPDLPQDERPGFHEIRSLSIYSYKQNGVDPQQRAAHRDTKTTEGYAEGHEEWNRVQAVELNKQSLKSPK